MTTYRLMDGSSSRPGNGPGVTSYSGTFEAGLAWYVTQGGMWFEGFWWWCPAGGDTGAQKFCLWAPTGDGTQTLVPGTTVTSGTLTAGAWNYVPLSNPVQVGIGSTYIAATAWTAVNGFSDTSSQFGSGDPYAGGITNGPLSCWADGSDGGNPGTPYNLSQGLFSSASNDPTTAMPNEGSSSSNFWIDIQVSTTAPAGYSGSYRLWPNNYDANPAVALDSNVNYDVATEVHLSQQCTLDKIWFYSPSGATNLPTTAQVWNIATGTTIVSNTSPSWSGAAGSGWTSCSFSGVTLPPGQYKVSVFNSDGSANGWSAKSLYYWNAEGVGAAFYVSAGVNGITNGPLYAPNQASASTAYEYDGSDTVSTPPYTTGTAEPGQSIFSQTPGGTDSYPQLYVDGLAQNYWVDMEVTPSVASSSPTPTPTPTSTSTSPVVTNSRAFLLFFP